VSAPTPGTGRALDCGRCAREEPATRPVGPCSCLIGCGQPGCTGAPQPVIDKPTRGHATNREGGT
jgi:hypothetical protein